jgi:hypothetical protein
VRAKIIASILFVLLALIFSWQVRIASIHQNTTYPAQRHAAGEIKPEPADEKIAFYTEVLALFTALLAVVSAWQGYFLYRADKTAALTASAARDSIELAGNTAVRQLRAYIFPETAILQNSASSPVCSVICKNCGQTPAYDLTVWTTTSAAFYPLEIAPSGPDTPRAESCGHLGPRMTVHFFATPDPPITNSEVAAMRSGKGAIYLYGVVTYVDCFGESRSVKFCYYRGGHGDCIYADGPMAVYKKWNEAD